MTTIDVLPPALVSAAAAVRCFSAELDPITLRSDLLTDAVAAFSSRWTTDRYPGLLARHPVLLAGVLFRDFARARDDATVLVLRDPLAA